MSTDPRETPPKSPRASKQTRSFLMRRFERAGIHPRAKLGQNFLIDLNLVHLLVREASLDRRDVVLEVGTGTGSLTQLMAQQAGHVITVEVDRMVSELAAQELESLDNIEMHRLDILENKNRLNRDVLAAVAAQLDADPERRFKLVANLPYHVATPLISNLLRTAHPPHSMTVTIQKELADRIVARPRTKHYGALAIWIQSQCRTRVLRVMPPSVFWPRPKVHSAIIRISYAPDRRRRITDLKFFHQFVRAMFFHRRKFLRSELLSAFKKQVTKDDVDAVMGQLGLGPQSRAEELDIETMLGLSDAMRQRVDAAPPFES